MKLVNLCVGIAQEKRWAELSVQPPKSKVPKEPFPFPFIELTMSPELQAYIDWMVEYRKSVMEQLFNQ